jgi:hypothetical protein
MIRYYDRLQKIEEMFPLLHAAYKESISNNKFGQKINSAPHV